MTKERKQLLLISVGLVLATLVAYEPVRHNGFVNYDDDKYITENPNVSGGITQQSVIWAFTKSYAANWHPLTWLSHILDCEIYGLKPLGHHITNLLLHIANTLLLFLLLNKMTGAIWKSAFVAAAFALHPIHVESVAWVSERKDVLSSLFWMLTILAYVCYVKKPNFGSYMLVILAFVMGLMSKPMVVTLPFVLLLLDYWPLNRLPIADSARLTADKCQLPIETRKYFGLIYEKIPLFALSAISSVITFAAQQHGESVVSLTQLPLHIRTINAIGNYFNYVAKIIYPKGLAALYPLPKNVTIDTALIAVMGIVIILALWGRGRRWLVVGLLWYLGTLVPVIGFVQVGAQMMADRYTYLPSIGLFIIFAWGAEEIFSRLAWTRYFRAILASGTAAILIAMIFMTRIQIGYWHDSGTLYKRAIAVTENNSIMVYNYGLSLCKQGKYEEGIQRLKEAIQIRPNYILARQDLAVALLEQGKFDDAIVLLNGTLQWANEWPDAYKLYYALGWAYEQKDNLSLAETNYRKALELKPDYTPVQNGLASVLTKRRQRNIERPTLNIEP